MGHTRAHSLMTKQFFTASCPPSCPCGSTQPSHQTPRPHDMTVLAPTMTLLARRHLSGPPTTPKTPTQPSTTIARMGGLSPILPFLINPMATTSSNRIGFAHAHLFATVIASKNTRGGQMYGNSNFPCLEILAILPTSGALEGRPSSKGSQQHSKLLTQQSNKSWKRVAPVNDGQ